MRMQKGKGKGKDKGRERGKTDCLKRKEKQGIFLLKRL